MKVRRRRYLAVVLLIVLGASAAYGYRRAMGTHEIRVTVPARASDVDEYAYVDADPSYPQSYLRPVVAAYAAHVGAGARVLDLGCGNGALLASFEDRGWRRFGVDISVSGVEQARARYPRIRFVVADATGELAEIAGEGPFDLVISTEVIEHVYHPRALVRNAYRLLKPGGALILSTPYHGYLKNVAIAVTGRTDSHFNPLWDYGHVKFFSVRTIGVLLAEAGFRNIEFAGAGRVPYFWKSMVVRAVKPRAI